MPKHKKKGPLSLQGAVASEQLFRGDIILPVKVIHRDSAEYGRGLPAYLHPSSVQQLLHDPADATAQHSSSSTAALFLQLSSGSDCVLHARASADVPAGCILVDEVQQANLRLCAGEVYKFSVFQPPSSQDWADEESDEEMLDNGTSSSAPAAAAAAAAGDRDNDDGDSNEAAATAAAAASIPFELTDLDVEVRLLHSSSSSSSGPGVVQVDAVVLKQAFCKQCFGRVLAVNEYVVVDLPDTPPLLLRVTATNTLTAEEQEEVLGYHCFRGLFTPDTRVYLTASTSSTAQQEAQSGPTAAAAAAAAAVVLDTQHQLSQLTIAPDTSSSSQQQQQELSQLTYLAPDTSSSSQQQKQQQQQEQQSSTSLQPSVQSRVAAAAAGLQLLNAVTRAAHTPTNVVHVYTSDAEGGEWFPVKKKLLRPCIALTKAVRDSGDTAPTVHVDVDTLTFDRVLIFLEAQALNRKPPGFAVHLLDDLEKAGEVLCLRSLQDYCQHLKGSRQAALGVYSLADVQTANASGKVWLMLDGMVLDVGRWLPEHPGGATIIPAQSLNCDCSRFFEMYHASRESFLYLQEFYIGELIPEDLPHVPLGGRQPPSQDFLVQLREYTAFRQPLLQQLAQATPATHLGASKRQLTGH